MDTATLAKVCPRPFNVRDVPRQAGGAPDGVDRRIKCPSRGSRGPCRRTHRLVIAGEVGQQSLNGWGWVIRLTRRFRALPVRHPSKE